MSEMGMAMMGSGEGKGENRALEAAEKAISSPLLEDISIHGARGVLFTIAGGSDLTMHEIQEAAKVVTESIDSDARVIFGTIHDEKIKKGEVKVTVIACGFPTDIARGKKAESSIFGFSQTTKEETTPAPVITREKEVTPPPAPVIKERPPVRNAFDTVRVDREESNENGEDDDWSSIPAFLRRSNKK